MVTKNLLVELFVEELPPKALKKLGEAFAAGLADGLRAQGLATDQSAVTPFASPRRLRRNNPIDELLAVTFFDVRMFGGSGHNYIETNC